MIGFAPEPIHGYLVMRNSGLSSIIVKRIVMLQYIFNTRSLGYARHKLIIYYISNVYQ